MVDAAGTSKSIPLSLPLPQFMSEMLRVAMPGGKIILVTWCHRPLKAGEQLAPNEQARSPVTHLPAVGSHATFSAPSGAPERPPPADERPAAFTANAPRTAEAARRHLQGVLPSGVVLGGGLQEDRGAAFSACGCSLPAAWRSA